MSEIYEAHRTGLQHPRLEDAVTNVQLPDLPQPGEEAVGPTMFDMVIELRRAQEVSKFLMDQAENLLRQKTVVAKGSAPTDSSGVLELPIYQVPPGFQLYVTRWNVEAIGFSPAVPYTNAAGQLILFSGKNFGVGSILDFLPNPPVASGAILPASIATGKEAAALFRGGEQVSIRIAGGPVSTAIYARIQGIQEAV